MTSTLGRILRVALLDLRRQSRRRANIIVLALFILPLVVALIAKNYETVKLEDPGLWASMLGVDLGGAAAAGGGILAGSFANLFSWWWLIVAIYAGDLIARDLEEGTVLLVAARPVRRYEILAGKMLSVLAVLTVFSIVGAYVVYASAWILAGQQEPAWGPLVAGLALILGSLPLLAFGLLVGVITRKTIMSMISVIAVVFITGIITSVLAIVLLVEKGGGNLMEASLLVSSALPLDGGKHLATLIYTYIARGPVVDTQLPLAEMEVLGVTLTIGGEIEIRTDLELGLAATAAWTLVFLALAAWKFSRKDL